MIINIQLHYLLYF